MMMMMMMMRVEALACARYSSTSTFKSSIFYVVILRRYWPRSANEYFECNI